MVTKPRPWPNGAKEARDAAAEANNRAIRWLVPVLRMGKGAARESEMLRRVALALNEIQNAVRWLERAGAPTIPQA